MRWIPALLLCVVASLLPWRLRIWFAAFLGWSAQALHYASYLLLRVILRRLEGRKPRT